MNICCKPSENGSAAFISETAGKIVDSYRDGVGINRNDDGNLPRESEILSILNKVLELVFPGFSERTVESCETLPFTTAKNVADVYHKLTDAVHRAFRCSCAVKCDDTCKCLRKAECAVRNLLTFIPQLREIVKKDIQAAYDGDPAAKSFEEIILSYPGIKTITIQRIAHKLYEEEIPLIPRMMGEYAHRITAIDIHPGAALGEGLFIDHGTGVVIGETAEIGNNVKIYQGVTLGALSFPKDACGKIIKGAKRHPTIRDGVTLYAGATILGPVVIGENSVIGGNVWLTEGVPAGTKITIAPPELTINTKKRE